MHRLIKVNAYFASLVDAANLNPGLMRLIGCLIGMLITCHWIGCFWFMAASNDLRYMHSFDPRYERRYELIT